MKIVIAGAGEVGTHLAKMLSEENQDIILMDPNPERLSHFDSSSDILTMEGNPTSLTDLEEADIRHANLFVSVTPEEATNLTACLLAHNLGARRTVARINNYEYLQPHSKDFFEKLGISSMIYPEMLAAKEIVSDINMPWTRQYWELFGGALILLGVKVRNNAQIVNKRLCQLLADPKLYHVVAIKRKDLTIIPGGNDYILPDDIVFFTTTRANIEQVRIQAGKSNPEVKKIFIMGGSEIALRACQYLPSNIRVKIFEIDKDTSQRIAEEVPDNVLIINGDARDPNLLIQEGITDAQAFIALTDNSSTNILACIAAKRYSVFKTVAKIENINYIPFAESMDIGAIINKKLIAASHIYQYLLDADVANVKCLAFANADVAELVARPDSKITKHPVKDLHLTKGMTLGGLLRNGEPMMVNGETLIQPYDHIVVFCLNSAMRHLEDYFN